MPGVRPRNRQRRVGLQAYQSVLSRGIWRSSAIDQAQRCETKPRQRLCCTGRQRAQGLAGRDKQRSAPARKNSSVRIPRITRVAVPDQGCAGSQSAATDIQPLVERRYPVAYATNIGSTCSPKRFIVAVAKTASTMTGTTAGQPGVRQIQAPASRHRESDATDARRLVSFAEHVNRQ